MKDDSGGPAFPTDTYKLGMTLRDYFAAQALQSLVLRNASEDMTYEETAGLAYKYADAMLAERAK